MSFETPLTEDYNLHKYREEWEHRPEFRGNARYLVDHSDHYCQLF